MAKLKIQFYFRKSKSHSIKADDSPKGDSLLLWKRVTALLEVMTVLSERMGVELHAIVPPLFLFLSLSFEASEISKEETIHNNWSCLTYSRYTVYWVVEVWFYFITVHIYSTIQCDLFARN